MVREEYNLPLTKESYGHLLPKIDGLLIAKTRYLIPLNERLTAELDIFEKDLAPLTLVEVEFDSVEEADKFTAPDWFGEDVTNSGKYHNSYLSRHGLRLINAALRIFPRDRPVPNGAFNGAYRDPSPAENLLPSGIQPEWNRHCRSVFERG